RPGAHAGQPAHPHLPRSRGARRLHGERPLLHRRPVRDGDNPSDPPDRAGAPAGPAGARDREAEGDGLMDLGIAGRRALVCGASRGLGFACAEALAREGVAVTLAARNGEALAQAAARIGAAARWVVADVATEAGRAAALEACPEPDIVVTNAGGPPGG